MKTVYNKLYGENPNGQLLLLMLGLEYEDFMSFVDINISAEGKEVTVFCLGEGIRDHAAAILKEQQKTHDLPREYQLYIFDVPEDALAVCTQVWDSLSEGDRMSFEERMHNARKQTVSKTQMQREEELQSAVDSYMSGPTDEQLIEMEKRGELDKGRVIKDDPNHFLPEGYLEDVKDLLDKKSKDDKIKALRDSIS